MAAPRKFASSFVAALSAAAGVPALAVAMVTLLVAILGKDPSAALGALYTGSVGSPTSVTESLIKTTPLILTGLSVAVAFRCGIWNIGAEGQLLIGMLGSAAAALALPPLPPVAAVSLCLLAGAAGGAAWAALPAVLRLKREVPEVVSTIMLNFLAVYLVEYLVRGPLRDPKSASDWSPLIPQWARLARLADLSGGTNPASGSLPYLWLPGVERLHLGVFLALLAVPVVWVWLACSRAGFRISAVGLNPAAARTAGIPVAGTIATAFLVSGLLAGLAGGIEVLGLIQRMHRYEAGSPGYGFSGIAVALLGQLHPVGVLAAALFFGALHAGSSQMERSAGISFQVAYIIQAAIVLLLVCIPRSRWRKMGLSRTLNDRQPETAGTGERNAGSQW